MKRTMVRLVILAAASPAAAQWTVINLHPAGASHSYANAVHNGQQGGEVSFGTADSRAVVWTGTASSWISLEPLIADFSSVADVYQGQQVGNITVFTTTLRRASLWNGSSTTWLSLHPEVATDSWLTGLHGGQQVGYVRIGGVSRASLWTGTALSWVDLTPAGATSANANDVFNMRQVGSAVFGGVSKAGTWRGNAASWESLHPASAAGSSAACVYGPNVGGSATFGTTTRASLWQGVAWFDLHPAGATNSHVSDIYEGLQVGFANFGGVTHAMLWSGTAAPPEDLSLALAGSWGHSDARGVWSDGAMLYVVGYARNLAASRNEAIMWRRPLATGACCLSDSSCAIMTVGACSVAGGVYRGDNTACATANCQPLVSNAITWNDNGNLNGNNNGILEPGEAARIVVDVGFTPPVGTTLPANAPGFAGPVAGLAVSLCDLNGGAVDHTGTWTVGGLGFNGTTGSNWGLRSGWTLGNAVGTPQASGDLWGFGLVQGLLPGPTASPLNPVVEAWRGKWQPTSYNSRTVTFSLVPSILVLAGQSHSVLIQYGVDQSQGYPLYATHFAPGQYGSIQIPIAAAGACCLASGACSVLSFSACTGQGGVYHGDNSACAVVNCPQPSGACCAASGCQTLTQAQCAAVAGVWQGAGTSCISACPQPCYPNCDGSTATPVLTPNDFQCFLNAYASGASHANCDGSTGTPLLTPNDFQCFVNAYATGCP
jgi:hypothetical protein